MSAQPHPVQAALPEKELREVPRDWVARARALRPLLDAAGPRIEAACALPADVLDALHQASMFRMLLPRSLQGGELDLATFVEVVCEIAAGDASTGWCLVQNSGCATAAAYMAPEAAREVFGDAKAVLAWGFPLGPHCRATPVPGGWKVNGSWGFGSGNRHSGWLGGHCAQTDAEGNPLKQPDGRPMERTMLFPRASATIKDDVWDVLGLRGTGSDTYSVTDLFVPSEHAIVARASGRDQYFPEHRPELVETERREQGTLYRFSATNVYQCGFAAVALGIARAVLTSFIELAARKSPSGANVPLREDHCVQTRIAMAEARLGSARAWLLQTLRDMHAGVVEAGRLSLEQRVQLRLAATFAIRESVDIVDAAYADAGATAIFQSNPFERRFRDIHTAAQQIQSSASHFQTAGQYYLGMAPSLRFI